MKQNSSIVDAIKKAGVVGCGGGGFPTHVKFEASVNTVIANGSECEPLLETDTAMMMKNPALLIEGVNIAMKATGASKAFVAVKKKHKDLCEKLNSVLPKDGRVELFLMDDYYPAGDEFLLVYDITGKVIPEGGLPLEVGVVVMNVVTLMQAALAVKGIPVTSRPVTISGAVAHPVIVEAPVGATYRDLIDMAGGCATDNAVVIDGGPMMGKIVDDIESGIAKTTSGVVVLPSGHFVVVMKTRTISQEMKLSRAACCQCFRCTDLCPRNLLGHDLYPHVTMRSINYDMDEPVEPITSSFLCSQCGMCDMIACDIMRLSPRRFYAHLRQKLSNAGAKNPHRRKIVSARDTYSYRKMPTNELMIKIDVARFNKEPEFKGKVEVSWVRVPLDKHAGAKAVASVKKGDSVKLGDAIAQAPEGKLGARCHASITGKVAAVTGEYVEIMA